jgi:pimeloyl-ACP methyl ester carboxylesterase
MARIALPSACVGQMQLPQIGDGPARDLIMVHGLGANSGFWYASAVQWFRRFGRVTLFDLPGHGESDMPQTGYTPARLALVLGELLDHLQIARAHLVAHSFGGTVALSFASVQPHRVESLVLADVRLWAIEPPSCAGASGRRLQRLRDAGLSLRDPRLDLSIQVLVELARLRIEKDDPGTAVSEVLPGARSLFPGRRAAGRWLQLIETTWAYEEITDPGGLSVAEIAGIQQPILAVYGGLSARKASAFALRRSCPRCQLHMIPEVGHFFPLTRPGLFARPALSFLRSVASDNAPPGHALPVPHAHGGLPELPPVAEEAPCAGAT